MRIDISNARIINTPIIYIHDNILKKVEYNKHKSCLEVFTCKSTGEECILNFEKVVYFQMTACDFWGPSTNILDFEYLEPTECCAIPKLLDKSGEQDKYGVKKRVRFNELIETRMTLCSGDQLTIVCEFIDINK